MRISGPAGSGSIQKSGNTSKGKAKGKSGNTSGDSIKVSDAASLRAKAQTMLADMSDVRMERIVEIRDALENGSFQSNSHKVASQIISNALAEHPWS